MTLVCTFVHPSACPHATQPLFNTEYKRTNRTRASKIVRCFPHCCPTHRPRSYCGSTVDVEITSTSDNVAWDQVCLFGRFELHQPDTDDDVEPIELGDRIPCSLILNTTSDVSIWVKGECEVDNEDSEDQAMMTRHYVLCGSADGFDHWEYDWKSGTSQRQRSTPHHFRVYLFRKHGDEEFEVVAMATSPPFTFAVYRKHQHDPTLLNVSKEEETIEIEDHGGEEALTNDDGDMNEEEKHDRDEGEGDENQEVALTGEALQDLLWHHRHRGAATTTTNFALLIWLANEAEPAWLLKHSRVVYSLLQMMSSQDERHDAAPEHILLHYVTHCIPQFINLLPQGQLLTSLLLADALRRHQVEGKEAATMGTCVDLLCHLLDPAQATSVLAFVSAHASLPASENEEERQRQLFLQWIDMIAEQVECFLQSRGSSIESLVDDVVTTALLGRSRSQRQVRELLRNSRVLGQSSFGILVNRLGRSTVLNHDHWDADEVNDTTSHWRGRWVCRAFERVDNGEGRLLQSTIPQRRRSWPLTHRGSDESQASSPHHFGLLSTVAVILSVFGFNLAVLRDSNGSDASLCIRPMATVTLREDTCQLELDDVHHSATTAMPLVISSLLGIGTATKKAYYRARVAPATDDSTREDIEIEFIVVSKCENGSASTFRLVMRLAQPSSGSNSSSLILQRRRMNVNVRVQSAQPLCPDSFVTTEDEQERSQFDDAVEASVTIKDHVASVKQWHTSASFKCVYYAIE